MSIYNWVMNKCFATVKTRNNASQKGKTPNDEFYYDDGTNYDESFFQVDNQTTFTEDMNITAMTADQLEAKINDQVTYNVEQNVVTLAIPMQSSQVSPMSALNVSKIDEIEFIMLDHRSAAVSSIKYGGHKVQLTCSHVIQLIDSEELTGFYDVNPMICSKKHKVLDNKVLFKVKHNDPVIWFTRNALTGKDVYIETNVRESINCSVEFRKKRVIMSIAVVIAIKPDDLYISSGTLMTVNELPYIVTYRSNNDKGIQYLIAIAPLVHTYRIRVP